MEFRDGLVIMFNCYIDLKIRGILCDCEDFNVVVESGLVLMLLVFMGIYCMVIAFRVFLEY